MNLVLIRHAPRERNVSEIEAPLTAGGLKKATETAVAIKSQIVSFDRVLRSHVEAAKQTAGTLQAANLVNLDNIKVSHALAPDRHQITLADIDAELPSRAGSVAIVGHHPGITRLLMDLTGKDCRTIDRGEAVWVELQADGKAFVRDTFGSTYSAELLRKKVELKMTVSTFLAGFNIPVLVELLKDRERGFTERQIAATVLFTAAFCLFAVAVYMYDELLMPSEYWGPVDQRLQPARGSRSRFAHNYRLNGRMYAYMVRTWNCFFTPAVVCTALGFLALIFAKWPNENVLWVGIGCVLAIAASLCAHRIWRPRLGIED